MEIVDGRTEIEDVGEFVARLDELAAAHGVVAQAFDARYVVDRHHLRRAVELAGRAIDRGEAVADDEGVEILLYAAGRRQIDRALEMGVSSGDCAVVAVVVDLDEHDWDGGGATDDSEGSTADKRAAAESVADSLDDPTVSPLGEYDAERVRSFFDVSGREQEATRGALPSIVHERVALLVVER